MTGRLAFNLVLIALVTAVAIYLLFFWQARPEFELEICDGRVEVKRGKVSGRFVAECQLICDQWKISASRVSGVRGSDGRISLRFSKAILSEHHQRFRNAWGMCG